MKSRWMLSHRVVPLVSSPHQQFSTLTAPTNTGLEEEPFVPHRIRTDILDLEGLKKDGTLDKWGLINFTTLHEMQINACKAFWQKDLFLNFSKKTKKFEPMTYKEYGVEVDRTRTFLVDIGKALA